MKAEVLVAAAGLAFVQSDGSPETGLPWDALGGIAHEQDVVMGFRFKDQPVRKTVIQNDRMNAAVLEIRDCGIGAVIQFGHKEMLWLQGRGRCYWHIFLRQAQNGTDGFGEGVAPDLDEVVQSAFAADPPGVPAPQAVGDPQTVMAAETVGVPGNAD